MRIGVLELHQPLESQPTHFVSKSLSLLFLNHFHSGRRAAERVNERVIRISAPITFAQLKGLLKARDIMVLASGKTFVKSNYVPEKMPPVDLPGLRFQEPQSDTWKLQHRGGV